MLQDVMTCIREGVTIDRAGFLRERHADRHLKAPEEMARLFARHPDAVARSLEIIDRCRFRLSELRYQYPDEIGGAGQTPQGRLDAPRQSG
jgi:error-prone DNA polymerase